MYQPESDEEREFLDNYDPSRYAITIVTVDVVIMRHTGRRREVVLIKRKGYPYKDRWALPGGFMEPGETGELAARREVMEEAGMDLHHMRFMKVADMPDRDPRGRCISLVYLAKSDGEPFAGDDAVEAKWFKLSEAIDLPLAFDHANLLRNASYETMD